jgi:hypothetical protein
VRGADSNGQKIDCRSDYSIGYMVNGNHYPDDPLVVGIRSPVSRSVACDTVVDANEFPGRSGPGIVVGFPAMKRLLANPERVTG